MSAQHDSQAGFSLVETMIAIGVLTVGTLGLAGVFAAGMQKTVSSPAEFLATQKAAAAVESVFSARDSQTMTWAQLRNVSDGGVFLNGPQPIRVEGADGVVNTADDGAVETVILPGRDQLLGTADDITQKLDGFTREVRITDVTADLRSITVTITYGSGPNVRSYFLTAYLSAYA